MANSHQYAPSKLLFPELSYTIQGCFFQVYNTLGYGHKESVYQKALMTEFKKRQLSFDREKSLPIYYQNTQVGNYRPDFIIDYKIIIEIKALEFMPAKIIKQLVNYLKGTGYKLGYLVNFGAHKLQIIRRVWTTNYKPPLAKPTSNKIRAN